MGTAGQAQVAQAGAGAPAAGLARLPARLKAELLGQVPVAAADRGLVHGEAMGGSDLAAADLEQVEHLQVLEDERRPVGGPAAPAWTWWPWSCGAR